MLDILIKTDVELAWPTATAQTYLRQTWGWDQGMKMKLYLEFLITVG
jgi:hypothetical protein